MFVCIDRYETNLFRFDDNNLGIFRGAATTTIQRFTLALGREKHRMQIMLGRMQRQILPITVKHIINIRFDDKTEIVTVTTITIITMATVVAHTSRNGLGAW